MAHLIDTDVVIYHLNNVEAATQLVYQLFDAGVAISTITYMEALEGLNRAGSSGDEQQRFATFVQRAPIVPFGQEEAAHAERIREHLRRRGQRVRPRALDLLIAATARASGLTLVTNNPDDYRDIPELLLQPAQLTR